MGFPWGFASWLHNIEQAPQLLCASEFLLIQKLATKKAEPIPKLS